MPKNYISHPVWRLICEGQVQEATRQITEAFRAAGAFYVHAAATFGVSESTLYRWIARLEIREALDKIESEVKDAGERVERRGRPLGRRDSAPRAPRTTKAKGNRSARS